MASDLEKLFFNNSGILDEPSNGLQPSNELQRIIEANSRSHEILSRAQLLLDKVTSKILALLILTALFKSELFVHQINEYE